MGWRLGGLLPLCWLIWIAKWPTLYAGILWASSGRQAGAAVSNKLSQEGWAADEQEGSFRRWLVARHRPATCTLLQLPHTATHLAVMAAQYSGRVSVHRV